MKLIHYISTSLGQVYICATWGLFHNTIDILLRLELTQKIPRGHKDEATVYRASLQNYYPKKERYLNSLRQVSAYDHTSICRKTLCEL